ncbi:CUGBP Elav-like member 5 [Perkinsus chesapeaki]|uniref:CUGBP Elav-like member 5 n=1 Tax=Perkinsus chesapeaki TaxID=330153 RepID=A0A7J6MP66_PERCH|nr:CUGBP Elav-like member 5 [Perkinsus chesapeaki]
MRGRLAGQASLAALAGAGAAYYIDENYCYCVGSRSLRAVKCGAFIWWQYKRVWNADNASEVHERVARRIVDTCKTNEGLYVKIGQVLCSLEVALPKEMHKPLEELHDKALEMDQNEVLRLLRDSGVDQVIQDFEMDPVASASIAQAPWYSSLASVMVLSFLLLDKISELGHPSPIYFVFAQYREECSFLDKTLTYLCAQRPSACLRADHSQQVHKARLKDSPGTSVAVKLRKPSVTFQVAWDLRAYWVILWALEKSFDIPMLWTYDFTKDQFRQEMDLRNEAANSDRAKTEFAKSPLKEHVYVPEVYWSSEEAIVAEWIDDAVKVTDAAVLGVDLSQTVRHCTEMFAYQIFNTGLVGSAKVYGGDVLIDHGLYTEFPDTLREQYINFWCAIARGDRQALRSICESWGVKDFDMLASVMMMSRLRKLRGWQDSDEERRQAEWARLSRAEKEEKIKEKWQRLIEDTKAFPRELLFVSRCVNYIRATNYRHGSPVDRVAVMMEYALKQDASLSCSSSSYRVPWAYSALYLLKFGPIIISMPIESCESLHEAVTTKGVGDLANDRSATGSVDKVAGDGYANVPDKSTSRPVGKAIVNLADDPSLKTINLEAALPPPTLSMSNGQATTTTTATTSTGVNNDCKLFVGALPYFMTEQELYPLFAKFGTIKELSVQRDKLGRSRGCAWLRYASVTECEACIRGLHNHYWLGSMKRPLQVQFATSPHHFTPPMYYESQQQQQYEQQHSDGKDAGLGIPPKKRVFVGGLPKEVDEHDLLSLIQPVQGDVVCDVKIVRKNGNSDGAAFVEFITPEQAQEFMKMYSSGSPATIRGRDVVLRLDWPKPQVAPPHPSAKFRSAGAGKEEEASSKDFISRSVDGGVKSSGAAAAAAGLPSPVASTTASQSPRKNDASLASISAAVAAATVAAMKSSGGIEEANLASIIAAATAAATATAARQQQQQAISARGTNGPQLSVPMDNDMTYNFTKGMTGAAASAVVPTAREGGRNEETHALYNHLAQQQTRHRPLEDVIESGSAEDGPSRTLLISGLPASFALQDVVEMFKMFGPMRDVRLVSFPQGCAVVVYDSAQDAERARLTCDNFAFGSSGRCLSVRPMADSPPEPYAFLNKAAYSRQQSAAPSDTGKFPADPAASIADLIVTGIPTATTDHELYAVFSEFGRLKSVRTVPTLQLGVVSFNLMDEAVDAMNTINWRINTGDRRVPFEWCASGVHAQLGVSMNDDDESYLSAEAAAAAPREYHQIRDRAQQQQQKQYHHSYHESAAAPWNPPSSTDGYCWNASYHNNS